MPQDVSKLMAGFKLISDAFARRHSAEACSSAKRVIYHATEVAKAVASFAAAETLNQQPQGAASKAEPRTDPSSSVAYNEDLFGFSKVKEDAAAQSSVGQPPEYSGKMNESAVPDSQTGRVMRFGSLATRMLFSSALEKLTNSGSNRPGQKISAANAERLAEELCRMRGAALKLGQMLSLQDETMMPAELAYALDRVRQGANYMPKRQLDLQMEQQLGINWRDRFVEFNEIPLAAASIGQVHRVKLTNNRDAVIKIQYPGVARSINSDLNNLKALISVVNVFPPGLFIDQIIKVAKEELALECQYLLEAKNQERYKEFVAKDPILSKVVYVPAVYHDYTTDQVLVTEYVPGVSIHKAEAYSQEVRNAICRTILYVTLKELFSWRFMQTDPNWGNYLYDHGSRMINMVDFGASRSYSSAFVDGYMKIVWAAANRDSELLMKTSMELGFLTGDESRDMLKAHEEAGMVVGEPFLTNEPYDFAKSRLSERITKHGSTFMHDRLVSPPTEVYSLHRKLAGAFFLCMKLKANIKCRDILEMSYKEYVFGRSDK
jgi:aarF domain-containing kinase